MAGGDRLSGADRVAIEGAIRAAERRCRYEISLYFGPVGEREPQELAHRLHRALVVPDRSVLVLVDPNHRAVEIVTGAEVRPHLSDADCRTVVDEMTAAFAGGDLVGGLARGVTRIGVLAGPAERSDRADARV